MRNSFPLLRADAKTLHNCLYQCAECCLFQSGLIALWKAAPSMVRRRHSSQACCFAAKGSTHAQSKTRSITVMKHHHLHSLTRSWLAGACALGLAMTATAQVPNRLSFNGQQVFVKGVNLPWYSYGDFGNHYQWGNMYNGAEMESRLSAIAAKKLQHRAHLGLCRRPHLA